MHFAEKESFHNVVLINSRNSPWTALITCANFSLETQVYNQITKKSLIDIGIKPIVSVNKEGYDCSVI